MQELKLKDKTDAFLQTSPKGTVPVLDTGTHVIAESWGIMVWVLRQNDSKSWMAKLAQSDAWIDVKDGVSKLVLDHAKYAIGFPERDVARDHMATF